MIIMKKIEQVINILAKEELTSLEISNKLDIKTDIIYVYLNKLLKTGKIERTNDKKPYKYKKSLTSIELLKFLNDFFKNNIEYLIKNPETDMFIEQNENIFNKIEEMIINAKSG